MNKPAKPPVKGDVRNSAIPRAAAPPANKPRPSDRTTSGRQITQEMIAKRAYEIFLSGKGGSPQENWFRAERELRANA